MEYHISDIVSLAIESVFNDPYEFKIEFVEKRGKTECEIWFIKNGEKLDPKTASGGGAVDVASFALRLALWNLKKPKSRNTLILDEPFKHLKGFEENVKVIQTIKLLSEKLGLQIIMVHDERVPIEEIKKGADKIFEVSIKKVEYMMKVARHPLSLEMPTDFEESSTLGDFIEDRESLPPDESATNNMLREHIDEIMKLLPPREVRILQLRYGLIDGRIYTLEEVGRKMGVTRERVRQIEAQALRRLRRPEVRRKLMGYLS